MKQVTNINNSGFYDLLIPAVDHKEAADDDCGLPENPIFSNYSKYLWQGRSENRRMPKNVRPPVKTDGHKHVK
jgi:hypothetical protein